MKKRFIFCFLNFLVCCSYMHAQTTKGDLCSFLRKIESEVPGNFKNITLLRTGKLEPLENYEQDDWAFFGEDSTETIKNSSPPNLAKQLLELLDYAKDGFKTIKGEPDEAMNVKNKYSGTKYFNTSVALEEAAENYIEESSSTIKFKADFGKNLTKISGKELFKALSKEIKEGAWNDFEIKEYSGYIFGVYLRIRPKNDHTHSILLTFDDGEYNETLPKVYITVE